MNTNEDRNFGYGAVGEVSKIKKSNSSLGDRIRYRFDNSINKGQGAFVAWLAIFGLLFSILVSFIRIAIEEQETSSPISAFKEILWGTSNSVLFDGKIPTGTFANKSIAILIWFASVTIAATIIAFVTTKLRDRVEKLRRGKSPIIESGHTLILGWSNRAFPIIEELCIANGNKRGSVIAIFADVDREVIEDQIASHVNDLRKTRIIIRNGDPTSPQDLSRANLAGASSIIVLDSDDHGDSSIVSTILSIKSVDPISNVRVIAEMDNRSHASALVEATEGRVIPILSNEVIARVTAQASRQPGLATVILDLLDFEGDEIYFASVKEVIGFKYVDAIACFNNSSIIGVLDADGITHINPSPSRRITEGEQLIAIASDDDQVTYSGNQKEFTQSISQHKKNFRAKRKAEHLLIIGWSHMGVAVLNELTPFLPSGSTINIVADKRYFDMNTLPKSSLNGVKVSFTPHTSEIHSLAQVAKNKKFNEVIILAYREKISKDDADTQTLLTMLLMNKLFLEEGNGVHPTRLVAEILDASKSELARVAAVDDLVVSDNLAALMIAQISENPALAPVFDDLFDVDGASINVVPIENYVEIGQTMTFGSLTVLAGLQGESAIGYYSSQHKKNVASSAVQLNPDKLTQMKINDGDGLIVVGQTR